MPDFPHAIDYEQLVADYNTSLNSVLRGFRPKYDFLELWVPDSDPIRSVKNLVESARDQGQQSLSLYFSAAVLIQFDFAALREALKPYGALEDESSAGGKTLYLNRKAANGKSTDEIDPLYIARIMKAFRSLAHQGSILEDGDNLLIRSTKDGISLFGAVHTASHTIRRARFSGTNKTVEAGLLEGLCEIIEGLPIQEAADHGLIKLEHEFRLKPGERGVKGIVNLFNYAPMFDLPRILLRDLYETYVKKTGYRPGDNFYHPSVSQKWKAVPDQEKAAAISGVFAQLLQKKGTPYSGLPLELHVMGIELHHKLNIGIQGDVSPAARAKLFMDFETELRQELDPSMEVFSQNVKDHNAIRRLKVN